MKRLVRHRRTNMGRATRDPRLPRLWECRGERVRNLRRGRRLPRRRECRGERVRSLRRGRRLRWVCPASNVQLGVYSDLSHVPLPQLMQVGARIALSADDPLLFHSRLLAQYETARKVFGLSDEELAGLARQSIEASLASDSSKARWVTQISDWLAQPAH